MSCGKMEKEYSGQYRAGGGGGEEKKKKKERKFKMI